jgi:flagellar biosynthesis anti-sigma factor FlgM
MSDHWFGEELSYMKVESTAAQLAQAAYRNTTDSTHAVGQAAASNTSVPAKVQRGDQASISTEARRHADALSSVQAAPDTRENLVVKYQAQIKNGTYKVNENNIADQLLKPSNAG